MARFGALEPANGGTKTHYGVFDGGRELADWLEKSVRAPVNAQVTQDARQRDVAFYGRPFPEAIEAIRYGDTAHVAAAMALESKVDGLLDWNARTFETRPDVIGQSLRFGAYMAGAPNCLKRRVRVENAQAPLTVVVAVNAASTVTRKQLINRGTAILAFVRLLSMSRPVTLWASASGATWGGASQDNVAVAVKIDAQPLSLSHAAFMLTDPAFSRRVSFVARNSLKAGVWCDSFPMLDQHEARDAFAEILGTNAADTLYIPRPNGNEPELDRPVEWLTAALATYGREPIGE